MARILSGTVTSTKGDKTIVVSVTSHKTHPIYRKKYSITKKFMAHDESNKAHDGDKVQISESRPLSARKRWTLVDVVQPAHIKHVEKEEAVE